MDRVLVVYIVLVILAAFYLFGIENIAGGGHYLHGGGRDFVFSFYDITLVLVFFVAAALSIISYKAYSRKKNERLMFVAGAFFLFAIKAALKLIDNFILGNYSHIGISIQTLELLILLSLFYALFRK
ncbi:MAG TPA: hypothetical protein VJB05_01295 [archaeon]|nr:hypothetical protein [archaeon]